MFYRLGCITEDGEMCGYQWREIDQETFVQIAQGYRVLGDEQAQLLNDQGIDPTFDNTPVYYAHVWTGQEFVTLISQAQALELYASSGQPTPGA